MIDYSREIIDEKIQNNDEEMIKLSLRENIVNKELDLIIIQGTDGRFSEGYTDDFSPVIPFFHLSQVTEKSIDEGKKIYFDNIKIIFFIQSIEDNSFKNSDTCMSENNTPSGPELEITFKDGEVLKGTMIDSRPNGFGFFLSTEQNNIPVKVFAVDTAIKKIQDFK